jgi:hypothetical protein
MIIEKKLPVLNSQDFLTTVNKEFLNKKNDSEADINQSFSKQEVALIMDYLLELNPNISSQSTHPTFVNFLLIFNSLVNPNPENTNVEVKNSIFINNLDYAIIINCILNYLK